MQVRFWGTRGSLAKPGPDTLRYGGNTACVQIVTKAGTLLILDCGTGAHDLGRKLLQEATGSLHGHMLISHTHWDHIQGIPFFAPLFQPGSRWDFYAPQGFGESLRETLAGQMEYTYFPVTPDAFAADIRYHNLGEGSFRIGDVTVRTRYLNHPALTLAYRIEADGAAVVYASDHEPHARALAAGEGSIDGQDLLHAEFMRDADLVIHDAQYTAAEYPQKIGWGHSTHEYAAKVCAPVGVKRLALTHHDPFRSDDALDILIEQARSRLGDSDMEVFGAAEGLTLEFDGPAEAVLPVESGSESANRSPDEDDRHLILLVTADAGLVERVQTAVGDDPIELIRASSDDSARRLFVAERPALVIMDDALPGMGGSALSRELRTLANGCSDEIPMVIVGRRAAPDRQALDETTDWVQAPFSPEYARTRIRTWLLRGHCRWERAGIDEREAERLTALRGLKLLDTAPEERFDRFTRIAAALFDAPVSLVTLVDESRQWFKSCVGIEQCETSRDVSFCAHALKSADVMIVPDALVDSRFADNPLVTEGPRIRFYAGAPLFLADGLCVGTLCVLDTRPRIPSDREIALLKDVADLVRKELAAVA
ncbi:MAG TPA: GAF domain-containing protein [Allosphingosinicella sp.]|jgi:phosphoribosyl 1,2-cyclic phosphodiesterase/CheY-like chemotaxis protein|uniref:GAF domain-containing protein n=1 Tax=Allosphingosinicella sp. TaxID=2823234 RepID=UPI002F270F84